MADTKITGLTVGIPAGTDIFPYVSSPGASPVTKKSLYDNGGWIGLTAAALTRTGATTFTTSTDVSAILQKGYKLKLTDTTTKYFAVVSAVYSAGVTTITTIPTTAYTLVGNPSAIYYSNVEMPFGWPEIFAFTSTPTRAGTAYTNVPTVVATWSIHGQYLDYIVQSTMHATPGGTSFQIYSLPVTVATRHVGVGVNLSSAAMQSTCAEATGSTFTVFKYDGAAEATASNVYLYNGRYKF